MTDHISIAKTDEEIQRCYEVMAELRPHVSREDFLTRVKRQADIADYELAFLAADDGEVKAVAGIRITESLAWGKYLCVDDLISKSEERSKGYGGALFDWLVEYAKHNGCDQFHLDSNVQRFAAHRFYLGKQMSIEAHHFGMKLKSQDEIRVK
ncbi:MAG TPA: GNAT family N-acetyltransferase [Pyrinomonadaceae bacterium]|nr:GNAT family N-acetyltransferase [Pyrinomonadaceae bacterium]